MPLIVLSVHFLWLNKAENVWIIVMKVMWLLIKSVFPVITLVIYASAMTSKNVLLAPLDYTYKNCKRATQVVNVYKVVIHLTTPTLLTIIANFVILHV